MKNISIHKTVDYTVKATTLIVDLRDFTSNLNASPEDNNGINSFCHFLSKFYRDCLDACLLAFPSSMRNDPPLYMSSTGDGALIVFSGEWHFGYGFLSGIILDITLSHCCAKYNQDAKKNGVSGTSFGIGIESGKVSRIQAHPTTNSGRPIVDTYIGHCINIAARAESISKILYQANTVVSDATVELVAEALFQKTFEELRTHELYCSDDEERLSIHDKMNKLNHELCLSYINRHILKGVDKPVPLYRLSRSALQPGLPRFDALVRLLVRGNKKHFIEVLEYLESK